MPILNKEQIKAQLLESGKRLVKVRQAAALIKNPLSQVEPEPISTAQSTITPGSVIQGKIEG